MLRNALVAGVIATLGLVGVSYAQTGALNPIKIVTNDSQTVGESPDPGATPESTEAPEPTDSPEPAAASHATPASSPDATPQRSTEGCPAGFTGNHGQFVSGEPKGDRSEAAQSDCGKPVSATQEDDNPSQKGNEPPEADEGNHEHGDQGSRGSQHVPSGDHGDD